MPSSKAQQRATNKYIAKTYDRLNIVIPKGQKATVQTHADQAGESVNGYVNKAVLDRMGMSDWPQEGEEEASTPG
jgi:hypothetical protein